MLLALATVLLAAAAPPIDGNTAVGPLRLGMTLEEARAAMPRPQSVDASSVEAFKAFALADVMMDARFSRSPRTGKSEIELFSRTPIEPGRCIDRFTRVIEALETTLGPFEPADPTGYRKRRTKGGSVIGWFIPGKDVAAWDNDGQIQASAYIHANGGPIEVLSQGNEETSRLIEADGGLECNIWVRIRYAPGGIAAS